MAGRLVFLLEEPSMKRLLEGLLPRLMPGLVAGHHFVCVPHEGKSDLDRSIPRKLSAWQIPGDRFVVVRDNDGADCVWHLLNRRQRRHQQQRIDHNVGVLWDGY